MNVLLVAEWQLTVTLPPDWLHRYKVGFGRDPVSCQQQQAAPRPKPTLDIIRKSGGIVAVTRRSKISKAAIQGNATPSESYRLLG